MISVEAFLSSDSEEENVETNMRLVRRKLRDTSNPMGLPDAIFIQLFRVSKPAFLYLLEEIENEFKPAANSLSVPNFIKLASALRFFAEGGYQRGTGQDSFVGMAQSTVSTNLKEVLAIMCRKVCPKWITYKMTSEEKNACKVHFFEKTGFPGVIGCVDGTHINIIRPKDNEHLFYNRKGYHSLNAMVICDHLMKIRCIDGRYGGASHDSFVWNLSEIRKYLEEERTSGDSSSWILGDSGYPLEPWLITPFRAAEEGSRKATFNSIHSKTRNIIERTIGLVKSRFRCILGARQLHYTPEKALQIVNVCCALHNICLHYKADWPVDTIENIAIIEPIHLENMDFEDSVSLNIRNDILNSIVRR